LSLRTRFVLNWLLLSVRWKRFAAAWMPLRASTTRLAKRYVFVHCLFHAQLLTPRPLSVRSAQSIRLKMNLEHATQRSQSMEQQLKTSQDQLDTLITQRAADKVRELFVVLFPFVDALGLSISAVFVACSTWT
jgi:hypothetical protein